MQYVFKSLVFLLIGYLNLFAFIRCFILNWFYIITAECIVFVTGAESAQVSGD